MSALLLKADIERSHRDVRLVPEADVCSAKADRFRPKRGHGHSRL